MPMAGKFIKKGLKILGMKPNETLNKTPIDVAVSPYLLSLPRRFESVPSIDEHESAEPPVLISLSNIRQSTEFYAISLVEGNFLF
jgi:hypothetical protein